MVRKFTFKDFGGEAVAEVAARAFDKHRQTWTAELNGGGLSMCIYSHPVVVFGKALQPCNLVKDATLYLGWQTNACFACKRILKHALFAVLCTVCARSVTHSAASYL